MKRKTSLRIRLVVMLGVLAVVAVGYFTSAGIGNLSGIGFGSITLLCPLGALLVMLSEKTLIPLAAISVIVVLVACIVLGKVFCSWVCPVHFMAGLKRKEKRAKQNVGEGAAKHDGAVGDAPERDGVCATSKSQRDARLAGTESLQDSTLAPAEGPQAAVDVGTAESRGAGGEAEKPIGRTGCATCKTPCGKAKGIKIDSRHGILAAALGSTLVFGFPVFCLVCPVGLTFATVLLGMRLFAFGETTWTIVVFAAIIVAEIVFLPKWCQRFCPLGALLSLFSGPNKTFRPQVDASTCLKESQGKACSLCEKACPEGINLHDIAAGETTLNDCSKCRACADACPERSIAFPLIPSKNLRPGSVVLVRGGASGGGESVEPAVLRDPTLEETR